MTQQPNQKGGGGGGGGGAGGGGATIRNLKFNSRTINKEIEIESANSDL